MAGPSMSGISTSLPALPTLPANASIQDVLDYEKAMMVWAAALRAQETAIETVGNGMIHATNTAPSNG